MNYLRTLLLSIFFVIPILPHGSFANKLLSAHHAEQAKRFPQTPIGEMHGLLSEYYKKENPDAEMSSAEPNTNVAFARYYKQLEQTNKESGNNAISNIYAELSDHYGKGFLKLKTSLGLTHPRTSNLSKPFMQYDPENGFTPIIPPNVGLKPTEIGLGGGREKVSLFVPTLLEQSHRVVFMPDKKTAEDYAAVYYKHFKNAPTNLKANVPYKIDSDGSFTPLDSMADLPERESGLLISQRANQLRYHLLSHTKDGVKATPLDPGHNIMDQLQEARNKSVTSPKAIPLSKTLLTLESLDTPGERDKLRGGRRYWINTKEGSFTLLPKDKDVPKGELGFMPGPRGLLLFQSGGINNSVVIEPGESVGKQVKDFNFQTF